MAIVFFPRNRPANGVRRPRFRFADEVRLAGARAIVVGTRATLGHWPEALCLHADGTLGWVPEPTLRAPVVKFERRAA